VRPGRSLELKVRVQSLLNAAKWIHAQHGDEALALVLRRCSVPVRERYANSLAIEWHPQEELIEFITVAETTLGKSDGQLCVQFGAAGARANLGGIVQRTVFYFANREYMFRRIASLWRQFNDEGELKALEYNEAAATLELTGIPQPNAYFCALLTGWSYEVALALGANRPQTRHVSCLAARGTRCLWEIAWKGFSFDENELTKIKKTWGEP